MTKFFSKWGLWILAAFIIYMVVGLMAPFWVVKQVGSITTAQADRITGGFFLEGDGPGNEISLEVSGPGNGISSEAGGQDLEENGQETQNGGAERAMILETNTSAWEERIRLFSQAKERIVLTTFDMRDCESARDLMAVLLHKADEGVQVQILVDGISGVVQMDRKPLFHAVSSHPNMEIRLYNKLNPALPWKTQGRMHDKYVIADDLAYILGGRNTFDYFIGDYPTNSRSHDREVLVYEADRGRRGESLIQLETYFDGMWNHKETSVFHKDPKLAEKEQVKEELALLKERYLTIRESRPDLFEPFDYEAVTHETEKIRLLTNPTGIYGKEPAVFHNLIKLMSQAEERVIIQTPYIVCNSAMLKELKALKEAVPDTRILINSVENGDNFMASSDYLYRKKGIWKTGIPVFEYDGGYSAHGKSMVIDDSIAVIGSYNLDLRSTYVDTELMLVIKSPGVTEELAGYMANMERDSRRVTEDGTYEIPDHLQVAEMPFLERVVMRIVGLIMQPFRVMV